MAINLLRLYNTQEEYDNEKCSLHEDTLSVIIENDKVNYGVKNTIVIINNEEIIDFPNGTITDSYFDSRTDIATVEIGCGINEIGAKAFYGCTSLKTTIIRGNLTIMGNNAFYNCTSLRTFNYYGSTVPNSDNTALFSTMLMFVKVTTDYEGDDFCGIVVNRVL